MPQSHVFNLLDKSRKSERDFFLGDMFNMLIIFSSFAGITCVAPWIAQYIRLLF